MAGKRSEEERRRAMKEDDEVVEWVVELARRGLALTSSQLPSLNMDREEVRDAVRNRERRDRAADLGLLRRVRPDERRGVQGWAEVKMVAAGPKEGGEWEADGELALWEWGQQVASWGEEVERTGGGAWPDSMGAEWHQINR